MGFATLIGLGLPLLMAFGAVAAWMMTKDREKRDAEAPAKWRDDSLDDWRQERDAAYLSEREQRAATPKAGLKAGAEEEVEETQKHQRIGG
ncbi:MAG: hypothetical protein ACSLFM_13050 [Tepidiformaceae bacterium]